MDRRTGGEDSSSCPFRLSTALEGPAGYADLGNSNLDLASAITAYVQGHICDTVTLA